jgi:hypothetical protein
MGAVALAGACPALAHHAFEGFPAGQDSTDSDATMEIEIFGLLPPTLVQLSGPTVIGRGDPFDPGDGHWTIETEIVEMSLTGLVDPVGPITVSRHSTSSSLGFVTQIVPGIDFPAESFFDVFVEVETPLGPLFNSVPVGMLAEIQAIPPFDEPFSSLNPVELFESTNPTGPPVGRIVSVTHTLRPPPISIESATWGRIKQLYR